MTIYKAAKPDVSIPKQEEDVLSFWGKQKIFEKTLEATKDRPFYSFYDGPPFATGLPHYGHLVPGILKDIVPRYWTMKGYHVPRRFGWDCHGLPVEYEINKAHKIESSKDVHEMGVRKYNELCRGIVKRYTGEWKKTVDRIGRWVDMDEPYFTMDRSFMQSVWWGFKQLWDKNLIYKGYKVVPYSVGVSTPLSNFEANLNYKDVQDPAITVAFQSKEDPSEFFLAWTTTPWTLPSNLGLAVGEDLDYVRVESEGKKFVLALDLVSHYFNTDGNKKNKNPEAKVLEELKGKSLLGKAFKPLLEYFADKEKDGAFKIIPSGHVTTESGTGIVHMAPAFGEDDYNACNDAGFPLVNPVDDDGMFTNEIPDFKGQRVKDADKGIIEKLKKQGSLFKQETITHSYPFCWRSDTPLIYKAVTTWFVRVEEIRDRVIANNKKTNWVPDHLRDGRFGNWLEQARDWAISRNRFWGCPLPVWANEEGETICIGSADELEKLTGQKVDDLHMENVDPLEIPSPTGKSPLKRVEGVLDCWFESGSMPYAQNGYPKTNKEAFEKGFPANFIAEGLDQTRGWFYTLMIIGTGVFDDAPFRNLIVNGLVLAEDGKKMSKSLRNYPDPNLILDQHGADALRLYLINSPVVRAQELRFSEKGVRDVVRKILLRWWNAYSFFVSYANIDEFKPKGDATKSPNILDQWIQSRLNSLIANTEKEMEAYRLYNVVPALLQFIEELTNTYIRFNRRHFWQNGMPEDKRLAYETLYEALFTLSKVMAPFTPFLSEATYRNLASVGAAKESVHLESFPSFNKDKMQPALEGAVSRMEQLVLLGRNLRENLKIKAKIPLKKMKIIYREKAALDELKKLESYFSDELNVREIVYDDREDQYVDISCKANFKTLGKRLGKKMKSVAAGVAKLQLKDILDLEAGNTVTIEGETLTQEDIEIRRAPKTELAEANNFATHQLVSLELDTEVTEEQIHEGLSREVVRRIQQARKNADLNLDDRISLELSCKGEVLKAAEAHRAYIQSETLALDFKLVPKPSGKFSEKSDIDQEPIEIAFTKA